MPKIPLEVCKRRKGWKTQTENYKEDTDTGKVFLCYYYTTNVLSN